jgi:hypothetical protein
MELDELKKELNQKMVAIPVQRSEEDIASLLQRNTVSVVQKLKRNLWIEMVVSVIFTAWCTAMVLLDESWVYNVYFSIFGLLGIAFVIVLYLLIRKTAALSAHLPVKQNIESLIAVINEYTRRYLQLTVVMMPLCFIFPAWLVYNDPGKPSRAVDWEMIAYLSLGLVAVVIAFYYFTRWYLRKMYGDYVRQLQVLASEFDENS